MITLSLSANATAFLDNSYINYGYSRRSFAIHIAILIANIYLSFCFLPGHWPDRWPECISLIEIYL